MSSKPLSRCAGLFSLLVLTIGFLLPVPAAATTPGAETPSPTVTPSAAGSHTTLPPYGGDTAPRPRTRQDRIISTLAPIAMVLVLVAGLYIYWLIRKGL